MSVWKAEGSVRKVGEETKTDERRADPCRVNSSSSTSTFNPQRSRVVHPPLLLNFPELVLLLPTRRSAQPHPETSRLCCGRVGPAGQKYSWILCSLKKKEKKKQPSWRRLGGWDAPGSV